MVALLTLASLLILSQVALYYGVKWVLNSLDPTKKKRDAAKLKSGAILKRIGVTRVDQEG